MANEFRKVTDQNGVDHPVTDQKAQDGVIANTKLIKDTVGWSGKNKLPCRAVTRTDNNVTFTVNNNKTVTANADSAASGLAILLYCSMEKSEFEIGENYRIVGCPAGGSDSTYNIFVVCRAQDNSALLIKVDIGSGVDMTVPANTDHIDVNIRIGQGYKPTNMLFKPMFVDPDTLDLSYEPYFGSTAFPRSEQAVLGAKNFLDNTKLGYNNNLTIINYDNNGISYSKADQTGNPSLGYLDLPIGTYTVSFKIESATKNISVAVLTRTGNRTIAGVTDVGVGEYSFTYTTNEAVYLMLGTGTAGEGEWHIENIMIRLASDSDDTFAPYAMTNKELTEVKRLSFTPHNDVTLANSDCLVCGNVAYISVSLTATAEIPAESVLVALASTLFKNTHDAFCYLRNSRPEADIPLEFNGRDLKNRQILENGKTVRVTFTVVL